MEKTREVALWAAKIDETGGLPAYANWQQYRDYFDSRNWKCAYFANGLIEYRRHFAALEPFVPAESCPN